MHLNRDLMFTFLRPYIKDKNATAEKFFPFPWDKNTAVVDLQTEIEAVEGQKDFWAEIDNRKQNLA